MRRRSGRGGEEVEARARGFQVGLDLGVAAPSAQLAPPDRLGEQHVIHSTRLPLIALSRHEAPRYKPVTPGSLEGAHQAGGRLACTESPAGVAQLAEQPPCKRQVSGSNPLTGSRSEGVSALSDHLPWDESWDECRSSALLSCHA